MLGITVPDAIAFSMMLLTALAAWRGNQAGKVAKKEDPPQEPALAMIGGALVDTATMVRLADATAQLAKATDRNAAAVEAANHHREHSYANKMDALMERLDEAEKRGSRR